MKKLFPLLLAGIFSIFVLSCDNRNDNDNDTISAVYDLSNVNLTYNASNGIATYRNTFNRDILNSDNVLIYRLVGVDNGNSVWQVLPQTIYNIEAGNETGHELEYTYDFTKRDISIYAAGTFDLTLRTDFIRNQTFRVVIVPGFFGRSANNESNDLTKLSYEQVIKQYNINDKNVIKL